MGSELALGAAGVFAVVTGANDGSSLLSAGLRLVALRVTVAAAVAVAFVAAGPLLAGTRVAATFTQRLVGLGTGAAPLVAIVVAMVVVIALNAARAPTSLTLALVGALTGTGLGWGLPVSWHTIAAVLAAGVLAPIAGGGLAYAVGRLMRLVPVRVPVERLLLRGHAVAFVLQCFAYSVNDGQKMLAVLAFARGTTAATRPSPVTALLVAALFGGGMLLGLRRVGSSLGSAVLAVRPPHAVSAELAASGAVLGSAALGMPVSMTQSLVGGLVGAGVSDGYGRVRWHAAARIALAWLVTLPASIGLAAATALAVRAAGG